jgi:DoxX-like family
MRIPVLSATGATDRRDEATLARAPDGWSTNSTEKVGPMSKISWRQVSALALAAFFVVGSLSNIFAPPSIYEEYLQWGYPHWFHFVTGSLELTTAVLLARERTRLWGAALGCTVMLAALATVTLHGEYGHGVAPLVAATLSILVGWIAWRKRLPRSV